ncbi:GATA transcription factor 27-like [Zingiber officinale]|uniref:GATA transcription factor 27-like n=1 Tax=Zingiber officinale TaxID=94328 RepID=UPI001C4CA32E|nr:GATA transcription factor 27-like [Zingiber officinale]
MVKEGPCRHCGVTSTPLWRNGPPEKPILCNACGSRWRTKGSLTNYVPLHAREAFNVSEVKAPSKITVFFKEKKLQKKKESNYILEGDREVQYPDQYCHKFAEGDTSNRSSSGSAISGSDSCVNFGINDASEITGSVQSNIWDSLMPSKKRTFLPRPKSSSIEKLTKDLHSILHEEQASNMSRTTEEDNLLYESGTPFDSSEIGYGGILIKHPYAKSVEEESEASSFSVDKLKTIKEGYSSSTSFPVNSKDKGASCTRSGMDTMKSTSQVSRDTDNRDTISHEQIIMLQDRESPLGYADLSAIFNFEGFTKYLTYEEQHRLMKYLPCIDTTKPPESLKTMFSSSQFLETFSHFQLLLREGVFDLSLPKTNVEECKTLRRLVLRNCRRFEWLRLYQKLKDASSKIREGDGTLTKLTFPRVSNFASLKRQRDKQNLNSSDIKNLVKSAKRACKPELMNHHPSVSANQLESSAVSKVTDDVNEFLDHEDCCFSPRSFFTSLPDSNYTMFIADSTEDDLLLDVPPGISFPEAQLLCHPQEQKASLNGLSRDIGVEDRDRPSSSFSNR